MEDNPPGAVRSGAGPTCAVLNIGLRVPHAPCLEPGPIHESGPLQACGAASSGSVAGGSVACQAVVTALLCHRVCPQCHGRAQWPMGDQDPHSP